MVKPLFSIDELPADGRLYLYGSAENGQAFAGILDRYMPGREFSFLDSTKDGIVMGRPVCRLSALPTDALATATIVIASSRVAEIEAALGAYHAAAVFDGSFLLEGWKRTGLIVRLVP